MPTGTMRVPSVEASPFNAVVGGGGYATISAAIAGTLAGQVIAVLPGTYIEPGAVAPKAGQSIIAYNGRTTDAVRVQMGDNQLQLGNAGITIKGIYFEFAMTTLNKQAVVVTASQFTIAQCTFDMTPTAGVRHRCLNITGATTGGTMRDIVIVGDADTWNHIVVGSSNNVEMRNFIISGGTTNPGGVGEEVMQVADCQNCQFLSFDLQALTVYRDRQVLVYENNASGTGTYAGNTYSEWKVAAPISGVAVPDILQIDGVTSQVKADVIEKWRITGGTVQISIRLTSGVVVSNCTLYSRESDLASRGVTLDESNSCIIIGCKCQTATNGFSFEFTNSDFNIFADCSDDVLSGSARSFNATSGSGTSTDNLITGCSFQEDITIVAGVQRLQVSSCYFRGLADIENAANDISFFACTMPDGINVDGLRCEFAGCELGTASVGPTANGDDCLFSGCDIATLTIASRCDRTIISGCNVGTLNNSGVTTRISGSVITTFNETGQDTIRDTLTPEPITVAGPSSVRGSRMYCNTGAVVGVALTLPDPNAVGVTVSVGYRVRFMICAAQTLTVAQPALQVIYIAATASTIGVGGSIASSTIGSAVELVYMGANTWMAVSMLGVWVVT